MGAGRHLLQALLIYCKIDVEKKVNEIQQKKKTVVEVT